MPFQTKTRAAGKKTSPATYLGDLPDLLTGKQVKDLLQLQSDRTLRTMVASGKFPRPIAFNPRLYRWSKGAVLRWFSHHDGEVAAEPRGEDHGDWGFAAGG